MRGFGLRILLNLAATAVAFVICAALLDGFDLNATQFVYAVIIFSVINWLVPIVVFGVIRGGRSASLGLILLLANAATLLVTNWLSDGIQISGAGTLILATIIIWVVNWLIVFVPGPWTAAHRTRRRLRLRRHPSPLQVESSISAGRVSGSRSPGSS